MTVKNMWKIAAARAEAVRSSSFCACFTDVRSIGRHQREAKGNDVVRLRYAH